MSQPRSAKTTRHKGITRVDVMAGHHPDGRRRRASHGYMARVIWQGKIYIKWFADARHGDRLGAFVAAVEWRNQQEQRVGKPRTEVLVIGKARTNTGLVGIAERIRGPQHRPVIEVTWRTVTGRGRRTTYSITKYGRRGALARAKAKRRREERARHGDPRT